MPEAAVAATGVLAVFADVQTPEQAMERLGTLDEARKPQVFAMFMKVKDERRKS